MPVWYACTGKQEEDFFSVYKLLELLVGCQQIIDQWKNIKLGSLFSKLYS